MYIGIDCGASHLRVGLISEEGEVLGFEQSNSPLSSNPGQFGQIIKETAAKLALTKKIDLEQVKAIGVGVPGPIDFAQGSILTSSNIGNSSPIPVKDQLHLAFARPTFIDRDTDVALRGEAWKGNARLSKDIIMLSLGTGVGGAIMINGKVDQGSHGMAGEIGHTYIEFENSKFEIRNLPACGLGHKGCLEAFIKHAKSLEEVSLYLGLGLANMVDIFNPERIIISGGMLKQGDFLPKAIQVMKQKGMHPGVDQVLVEYAALGEIAGVIGAAKLAKDQLVDFGSTKI